jgi:hypothetical protein
VSWYPGDSPGLLPHHCGNCDELLDSENETYACYKVKVILIPQRRFSLFSFEIVHCFRVKESQEEMEARRKQLWGKAKK